VSLNGCILMLIYPATSPISIINAVMSPTYFLTCVCVRARARVRACVRACTCVHKLFRIL